MALETTQAGRGAQSRSACAGPCPWIQGSRWRIRRQGAGVKLPDVQLAAAWSYHAALSGSAGPGAVAVIFAPPFLSGCLYIFCLWMHGMILIALGTPLPQ